MEASTKDEKDKNDQKDEKEAGAKAAGLMTAYVDRPLERGAGGARESAAGQRFDWSASDFVDLAVLLGA